MPENIVLTPDEYVRIGAVPRTKEEWESFDTVDKKFVPHLGEYIYLKDNNTIKYIIGDGQTTLETYLNDNNSHKWFPLGGISEEPNNALQMNNGFYIATKDVLETDSALDPFSTNAIANGVVTQNIINIRKDITQIAADLEPIIELN